MDHTSYELLDLEVSQVGTKMERLRIRMNGNKCDRIESHLEMRVTLSALMRLVHCSYLSLLKTSGDEIIARDDEEE
jgi:hypothetical protein